VARACYGPNMLMTSPLHLESPAAECQVASTLLAAGVCELRHRLSARGDRLATGGDPQFLLLPNTTLRLRCRALVAGDCTATPAVLPAPVVA